MTGDDTADMDNEDEYCAQIASVLDALESDDEALERFVGQLEKLGGPTWMRFHSVEAGAAYELPRFPLFITLGAWGNPTLTAAATALAELVAHDVSLAVAAGVVAELASRFKYLRTNELAVFDVLGRLAQGGSIYKAWIAEDELLTAMDPELNLEGRKRLLANMKSRELLEEGAGKWRAVW